MNLKKESGREREIKWGKDMIFNLLLLFLFGFDMIRVDGFFLEWGGVIV